MACIIYTLKIFTLYNHWNSTKQQKHTQVTIAVFADNNVLFLFYNNV